MPTAADSMSDFTGCILDGRYELMKALGSGSYGVVYQALDECTSSPSAPIYRAVKIIRKAGRRQFEIDMFRREVDLHIPVSYHPNIVTMLNAYEDNDYAYIILDLCPGGDLFGQILHRRIYEGDDELVRSAFLSLIDAVQACHDENIAHRDLKPENILTSMDGSEVYLADFGLATRTRISEGFGCGTSIYMSPECLGPTPYCTRTSDIWALGVILINMITQRIVWDKPTLEDPGFKTFVEDPTFLLRKLPISEDVYDILLRILTIDPIKRITLNDLRYAVLNIDAFFRTVDELARSPEIPQSPVQSTASESHISRTSQPYEAWSSLDCSAGTAVDSTTASTSTTTSPSDTICVGWSSAVPRASLGDSNAGSSSIIFTPEGFTPVTGINDKFEHGDDLEAIDWQNADGAVVG